ncbi:VOC family protein [Pseudidiomarina insulisalsae]|uniref:Glyoxalase n=1 Tax=Pseudidiomarina insulisalsae TaxID=575789 RepID=A0A432YF25_9GAMM|nr:VOC family protein [Pseudidiomarina insulisalsae]RUO59544.1 glyoxalase [Pseudidiomarina insulisalsae]
MSKEIINYVEFPVRDMEGTKRFFNEAFGWEYYDHGDDYAAIEKAGLHGGFFRSDLVAHTENGSAKVVLYSENLEDSLERVKKAGGKISKAIFEFPGGRRFQFTCPSGNEYAVWGDAK